MDSQTTHIPYEVELQAALLTTLLDKWNHQIAAPNITTVYTWECDLLSLTRANFAHEFEIKRSLSDYRADFKKKSKHHSLSNRLFYHDTNPRIPNYFWYVVAGLEVEPPEYAGLLNVAWGQKGHRPVVEIIKPAPRLHNKKLHAKKVLTIGRIYSYRLKNMYWDKST